MAKNNDSYQDLQAQLQEIMEWFEGGDVDIDKAAAQYEKGMGVIAKLEAHLKDAEVAIEKVKKTYTKK